jgi:Protein of unknown function (DUF3626)
MIGLRDDGAVALESHEQGEPGAPVEAWRRAVAHVAAGAAGPALGPSSAVTLHFHPDRLVKGRLLLEHLGLDRTYRSQFQTGTSNGGLTAHPGGDRWRWESRLFGGAHDSAPPDQRPKHGSLNHQRRPAGGSVRFGSAHFRVAPHVLTRTTFCSPDSSTEPTDLGTAEHMPLVALAVADHRAGRFDVLDDHIEAHVHGPLDLERDIDALVLDPCYRGTAVQTAAEALPLPTEWHHGFRLHLTRLDEHADFRGGSVVEVGHPVAQRLAPDGWLDARVIGDAVRSARWDGQDLERLWHCTARFGRPVGSEVQVRGGPRRSRFTP